MADTATYAGAMKTRYPDTTPHVARKKGDHRPSKGSGDLSPKVRRSAARQRVAMQTRKFRGTGAREVKPGPKANGILPL